VRQIMHSADQAAWSAAALALAMSEGGSDDQLRAAIGVLGVLGIDIKELAGLDHRGVAAQAAAPLLQTAAMLRGEAAQWAGQSDEALLAQGRASAQGAAAFAQFGLPMMTGLAEMLARPDARMLDVGTGVAALAVAYAELFPALTVVGVDVLPRVLALAAETVAASNVADRVLLRQHDIAELDEADIYALGWLPAPFVPEAALRTGATRIARALLPGGWLMVGHGKFAGDATDEALTRFKTVAYGGTALNDHQAQSLLQNAGLIDISTMPTPPGAPAITVGRKST
jgi:Methyltransferase domain